jgi:hypothetical protein
MPYTPQERAGLRFINRDAEFLSSPQPENACNTRNPRAPPVAQLYPPEIRDALVRTSWDKDIDRIDKLTDNLAQRGFVRSRSADANPERPGWWK